MWSYCDITEYRLVRHLGTRRDISQEIATAALPAIRCSRQYDKSGGVDARQLAKDGSRVAALD